MNEKTEVSYPKEWTRGKTPLESDYGPTDSSEVEILKPLSIETVSSHNALMQPMIPASGKFAEKYRFGLFDFYKVPPNTALIISGPIGTRVVTGRSAFVFLTEMVNEIGLELIALTVFERDIRTKSIYPVDIEAMVQFRVKEDSNSIKNAAQQLLSRSNENIATMIQEILSAHLRETCAAMTVDDLQNQMEQFNSRVVEAAQPNFETLGFTIKAFALKRIIDREGYFLAKIAETKAQLLIRQAEAQKQAGMRTADARLEGERRKSEVQALLEDIWINPRIRKYQCEQLLNMEMARSEMAGPIATEGLKITLTELEKRVKELNAQTEAIRIEELGRAEANASRLKGEAEAVVKTAMARIYQGLDQGSLLLYVEDRLPAVMKEIAEGVKNIDWRIIQTGGGSETAAEGSISKAIHQILFSIVTAFAAGGVDLDNLFGNKHVGDVAETIKKTWAGFSPEDKKSILRNIISSLDKDSLREIFESFGESHEK